MKPNLLVRGMHGLGDSIHQRAIMRMLMQNHNVTLETSWVSVYHDLIPLGLKVVRKLSGLRVQAKNAAREAHLFAPTPPQHHIGQVLRIVYNTERSLHTKSRTVLETMLDSVGLKGRYEEADYSLPIPAEWYAKADALIAQWKPTKPIMIYRPLTYRPEWPGSGIRAANPTHYEEIASVIRDRFFVVSVADLVPGVEDILGPEAPADVKLHKGELDFETMAAMFSRASLVFTAGGFAAILAPAVGTAVISVGGGYEPPSWMESGARFAPFLSIPTLSPCMCASSACRKACPKAIDIPRARGTVAEFLGRLGVEIGRPVRTLRPTVDLRALVNSNVRHAQPLQQLEPVMTASVEKLDLPSVTLLVVETQMHEMARLAILDATSKANFGAVSIHTDDPEKIDVPGAQYHLVPNWPVKTQAGTYCYNDAPATVHTPHMIFMEWDGGIRDVSMWDSSFLDYDYIGAPWPGAKGGQWQPPAGFTVGNGGFTLWSKKLTDTVARNRNRFAIFTDVHISKDFRPSLEQDGGLRWAPEELAYRFAFEHGTLAQMQTPSFGYHDIFNWPLALPREEVVRRTRLLLGNAYIHRTPKLAQLARNAPWITDEIPEMRVIRHAHPAVSARRPHWPAMPPGPVQAQKSVNHARLAYEAELQRRGLKA